MTIDDSLPARIRTNCPEEARQVLLLAWSHDLSELKRILTTREKASVQDPTTGETVLHGAVRACGPADSSEGEEDGSVEEAKEVVQELFLSGAIWNDVDSNNETPGCVASRLGQLSLYSLCVDAGVRAELLFALMDGYEELSSGSGDDNNDEEAPDEDVIEDTIDMEDDQHDEGETHRRFVPPETDGKPITNREYLKSGLTYDSNKLVDSDLNGIMMSWEKDIMKRSVSALLPDPQPGKRILNIGFGMGIIDEIFANTKPSKHHIIEAHPDVLEHISKPMSSLGSEWEASGPEEGAFKVFRGLWQDVIPGLLEQGETYDAIYFDTFGENYSQLQMFFTEYVPGLMDESGRFSFFNGLGADRRICYDVYSRVVEIHGADAGLDVEWEEIEVDMSMLNKAREGEWEGVRRRYWTLDSKFAEKPNKLL